MGEKPETWPSSLPTVIKLGIVLITKQGLTTFSSNCPIDLSSWLAKKHTMK